MAAFETITIDTMVAACNGGGGPLGHPKVYLNLAPGGKAECPYCSRLFVNRAIAAGGLPMEGVSGDTDRPQEPAPVGQTAGPTVHEHSPAPDVPR
ncbi:MAG TPA: zinc-finger domain-containing protein [Stellaceae bacterium]|nr:zinc-finger domain-containing protein [Stellaceae bacterium]